tara:strand:+ start:376 stop:1389 length:1014 start_codon:yes stop_codon:yes gene_type:complete
MALDGAAYSPKEFQVAIKAESTIGTANVSSMQLVNVDSVEMPNFNLTQVLDVRSGSDGRVFDVDDALTDEKGVTKEITFSGVFDTTVAPLLVQNCIGLAESSDVVTIPYNYTPPELETGDSSSVTIADTVTIAVIAPATSGGNRSIIFPGCTITSLSISGDMANESGRLRFTATARTGYISSFTQAAPSSPSAYGTSYYSLATLAGTAKKTIAGAEDCVIQSFSLNLENPSEYVGQGDASGNPEAIVRAVPELSATLDATVKYDNQTAELPTTMKAGSTVISNLANHATIGSASSFAFVGSYGKITNVAYNEANAMMYDVSVKFGASGSNAMLAIRT